MDVQQSNAEAYHTTVLILPEAARRMVRSVHLQTLGAATLLTIVIIASLLWNLWGAAKHAENLVWKAARSVADTVVAMRAWTADQGGVYVPVSESISPNPYLKVPDRDVVDGNGRLLTKVNPAYLTRLVAEKLPVQAGIEIRLVSSRPLRLDNRPLGWEGEALEFLEKRRAMEWGREGRGRDGRLEFQYVRALPAEAACLSCHDSQGYREGDLRGGLSLTLDYTPFFLETRTRQWNLVLGHGVIVALCLFGVGWFGRKLIRKAREMERAVARLRVMEGLLPICSVCKKIRLEGREESDRDGWVPVEAYMADHSHAEFSHGFCPECLERLYPEFSRSANTRAQEISWGQNSSTGPSDAKS